MGVARHLSGKRQIGYRDGYAAVWEVQIGFRVATRPSGKCR